jgi:thymidylate synthase
MLLEKGVYQSKLIVTENTSRQFQIGLCVGWDVVDKYTQHQVDIIGTLYTKNGAKIMLRNLFANPSFQVLIIVDQNPLGQNSVGKHGLTLMYDLFVKRVNSTVYNINELYKSLRMYYITNEQVHDCYKQETLQLTLSIHDTIDYIISQTDKLDSSRNQIIYEPDATSINQYIPNEYLGQSIRGISLFDAWFQVLQHINKYGHSNTKEIIEYHAIHWNYPIDNIDNSLDEIRQIITQSDVQQMIGMDAQSLQDYTKIMNENIVINDSSYTYGSRLHVYKDRIKDALKKDVKTRYAFATTLKYDIVDTQAPCMVFVQLLYDNANDALNLYAVFRSHDIFKAAIANGYALAQMLKEYASYASTNVGRVEITSISAHIYEADMNNAKLFINCLSSKLTDILRYDARGNCIIDKQDNGQCVCEIHDPKDDKIICSLNGTPFNIYKRILDEHIITDTDHLSYIFKQLFS